MHINLPNFLTLLRILFVPVIVVIFYMNSVTWNYKASAYIFALAGITDWFDGFIARKWNQTTRFGAFFDPVADKIIVITAFCLLIESMGAWYITIPILIILIRELTVSALREWNAKVGGKADISVNRIGKAKTFIQMVAITMLLYSCGLDANALVLNTGVFFLYIAFIFTVYSMFFYIKLSWSDFSIKR